MKVKKHHQLKNNSATTLSGVRPLGTLFVFFFVSCFPAYAVPFQETTTPKTFTDWCLNKANLSLETKHTIDAMLQMAETQDCNQAQKLLSIRTELSLNNNKITDLTPLSGLTNLTKLLLANNKITNLKPLSGLTNLTMLSLANNKITDLKPLSGLTT
jgi:internalin A